MLEGKEKKLSFQTKNSILISFVKKITFKLENHRVNGIKKKDEKKNPSNH
jgi:hypothetical protein